MRFRAEQHLRRPSEIRAVREQGSRVECRAFTLWWRRRARPAVEVQESGSNASKPSPTLPRVCVIASTAAVGNAVSRNRAKRRLRELFRLQQAQVPAECDLLLIARRAMIDCPTPELEQRFNEACTRIGRQQGAS